MNQMCEDSARSVQVKGYTSSLYQVERTKQILMSIYW